MDKWFYYYLRKETDPRILKKLNDAMNNIAKNPEFAKEIGKYFQFARSFSLDECSKFWDDQYVYYSQYQAALNEVL
jgi:tripartite-type tricarboxylate transporter receptor subunit TctC